MDDNKAVPNGFIYTVAEKAALFYADDGIISLKKWFAAVGI